MALKLNKILEQAVENIEHDREKAESLLGDIAVWIGQNPDRHAHGGLTAAKYLETLQRSNEQLVKIAAIIKTRKDNEYGDLDKNEKADLYQELEGAKDGEE